MNDHLFSELFPWPADRPLRRARFGRGPAQGSPLPPQEQPFDDARESDWSRTWEDKELGLTVKLTLRPDSADVWADVTSPRDDYLGKAVSVGLVGEQEDQLRRVTVPLSKPDRPEGCRGAARIGSLDELRDEFQTNFDLVVFLLE
jgi:hypothetical protein